MGFIFLSLSEAEAFNNPPTSTCRTNAHKRQPPTPSQVAFLATLVTYPFVYLLVTRAARGEGAGGSGSGGGSNDGGGGAAGTRTTTAAAAAGGGLMDGRRRLEDFAEGRAIVSLERCGCC